MGENGGSKYLIRMNNAIMAIFFDERRGIIRESYDDGNWSFEEVVTDKCTGVFSVNTSSQKELHLFFQDKNGNIWLYRYDTLIWKKQILQKNSGALYSLHMQSITAPNTLQFLYNVPTDISGNTPKYKIMAQTIKNGQWEEAMTIVRNISQAMPVFEVFRISEHLYVIFYYSGNNSFGFIEFLFPGKFAAPFSLFETKHYIVDKSVIAAKNGIHLVIIAGSQLIYKNKIDSSVSEPIVLFDSNSLNNVSILMHDGIIYVMFSLSSRAFFVTKSSDNGKTFTRPTRLIYSNLIKVRYVTNETFSGAIFSDGFANLQNVGELPFLREICPEFYTESIPLEKLQSAEFLDKATVQPPKRDITGDLIATINDKTQKISMLEFALQKANIELSEKNKTIAELNNIISDMDNNVNYDDLQDTSSTDSERISQIDIGSINFENIHENNTDNTDSAVIFNSLSGDI